MNVVIPQHIVDTNTRIISELESTKSKYLTATFYLNSTTPIVNCPDVIGAVFDERKANHSIVITREELIPLYIQSLKELANTETTQLYDAELLRDNIVLKSSRNADYSVEFAIGFYFLNSLRSEIPNFMQTYESFTCGSYFRGKICSINRKSNFLAIEKIEGVTASEFVKDLSYEDMCLLLLQVYLALIIANKKFEFCHLDLHAENVMVYRTEPTAITYEIGDSPVTIVVPFIAVIIDFGASRVVHNGEVLSNNMPEEEYGYVKNLSYIDFKMFAQQCASEYFDYDKLTPLRNMLPNKDTLGTDFSGRIIKRLMTDCTKYEPVKVYSPSTCKRRKRTTPVTSTLDYYEGYPFSRDREVDVNRILNNAIGQMAVMEKDKIYKTYCKLYMFFYESYETKSSIHREWYFNCLDLLRQSSSLI